MGRGDGVSVSGPVTSPAWAPAPPPLGQTVPLPYSVIHQLTRAPRRPLRARASPPRPLPGWRLRCRCQGWVRPSWREGQPRWGRPSWGLAAQVLMSRPPSPRVSAAGTHPSRAFCAAPEEERERGGASGAGCAEGLRNPPRSRVSGCRLLPPHIPRPLLETFQSLILPSQPQAKGSCPGLGNRLMGPLPLYAALSWAGRRGVFPRSLGDTYSDPILTWTGRGLPGRSRASLKRPFYQLGWGLGSRHCRRKPVALGGPH